MGIYTALGVPNLHLAFLIDLVENGIVVRIRISSIISVQSFISLNHTF